MKIHWFTGLVFCCTASFTQDVKPVLPVPVKQQLLWHDMEFYLFAHFGPNTFTDKEWGEGTEPEDIFNPAQLDCRQWARIAKQSGAKGIIITAKHHDGFCLWPSKYSAHTVRESKWKNGKGDVLKELSQACKEYGLNFGVYISPWDRNHPDYGTEKYNDVFVNMMKEIFTDYGPIWELWWDGANGEGPNGKKQIYDWHRFEKTIRELSPTTVIFSDIGPDIRWVGNENGIAGRTNWNLLDTAGFKRGEGAPLTDTLRRGNAKGKNWIPAECDVSIRPGWFYHKEEDDKVKTPEQLFDLYLKSIGRGANLLLNVPPDRRGLINEKDSAALVEFKKVKEKNFKENLVNKGRGELYYQNVFFKQQHFTDDNPASFDKVEDYKNAAYWIKFNSPQMINCIMLQEANQYGQRVSSFSIFLLDGANEIKKIDGTTIGRKRILSFPAQNVTAFRLAVNDSKDVPLISGISVYSIDEKLVEK